MAAALQVMCCNCTYISMHSELIWSYRLRGAAQRMLLWNIRTQIVPPFNETVLQVFARVSAYRDSLDGPQVPTPPRRQHAPAACCCSAWFAACAVKSGLLSLDRGSSAPKECLIVMPVAMRRL